MKKLHIIIVATVLLCTACEYNEKNFPGYNNNRPADLQSIDYILTDADYNTIAASIKDNTDAADFIRTNRAFSDDYPAAAYVGTFLDSKYMYKDVGSSLNLTYKYINDNDTLADSGVTILSRDTLAVADYKMMGSAVNQPGQYNNFSSLINPDAFLPKWLAVKYPISYAGNIRMVKYIFFIGNAVTENRYSLYMYDGEKWEPYSKTEQYVFIQERKWVFDPTVNYTLLRSDYKLMVDYIIANMPEYEDQTTTYDNEEWYYGFNSRYDNISFRPSGSVTSSRDNPCSKNNDTELHSLSTDEEKLDFLWKRMNEEGMIIFLQQRFPDAVAMVGGITVEYHITAKVYFGPTSIDAKMYVFSYKTLTSGTSGTPPTFEFVSVIEQ